MTSKITNPTIKLCTCNARIETSVVPAKYSETFFKKEECTQCHRVSYEVVPEATPIRYGPAPGFNLMICEMCHEPVSKVSYSRDGVRMCKQCYDEFGK
jgi:hypothetical protein